MVAELAKVSKRLNAPLNRAPKRSAIGDEASKKTAVQSPPLQPDAKQSATDADSTTGEKTGTSQATQKTTTFDEMVALWKSECRASWAFLPSRDRERFIEMLRRARRRARVDVVEFLKDVFRGRPKISKQDLFGIAATHGFARNTIRNALRGLGYRSKREGWGSGAQWFVINLDRDWKDQLPLFFDAELKAGGDARPNPRDTAAANDGRKSKRADYFEDL
jgi:hypothetical protein